MLNKWVLWHESVISAELTGVTAVSCPSVRTSDCHWLNSLGPETLATKGSLAQGLILKKPSREHGQGWNILPVTVHTPLISGGLMKGNLATLRGALRTEASAKRLSEARGGVAMFYTKDCLSRRLKEKPNTRYCHPGTALGQRPQQDATPPWRQLSRESPKESLPPNVLPSRSSPSGGFSIMTPYSERKPNYALC